jgi:predicted kinase
MSRFVLQMHGESGAGKSTLALAIGRATGAVALDKDCVKGPLVGAGIEDTQAGGLAYDAFYLLAESVLSQGFSVVLDSAVFWPRIARRGNAMAAAAGVDYYIVECRCGDALLQEQRLTARPRLASQPASRAELAMALDRPGVVRTLTEPHLIVDTTGPIQDCLREALRYIGYGQG